MGIIREEVIFEEIVCLENMIKNLKDDNNSYSTENKELQLKLGVILDENAAAPQILSKK